MAIAEEKREYNREYYQKNREILLAAQHAYDDANQEARRLRDREYYLKNRERRLAENKEYRRKNWARIYARQLQWQRENPERVNLKSRLCRRRLREEVFAAYGGVCECCREDDLDFLEIDHLLGGGNKHRKELGSNAKLYGWLRANKYPQEFRILCSNCNKAISKLGWCPHELERVACG